MKLERRVVDGFSVVGLTEPRQIVARNCNEFSQAFLELTEGDNGTVILDAAGVLFLDSSGLGTLLRMQKRLRARGGELVVAGLSRPVMEVFRMVGFDIVFPVHADVDEAIVSLGRDSHDASGSI